MTEREEDRLVLHALAALRDRNQHWQSNKTAYERMDLSRRLWWWDHAKLKAKLGVPAMQELVSEVIAQRMKG